MNNLETAIAARPTEELTATRRLLHQAEAGSYYRFKYGPAGLIPHFCGLISAELVRRGKALPCYPCQAELEREAALASLVAGKRG